MRLLALDQSSKTTGFAVFDDEKLIDSGIFTFTNADLGKRLERIREKIAELITIYQIQEVVLEDIQMENNNVVTYKALAEVIGVITELLTELKIKYQLILPTVWRSYLKISGHLRADCKAKAKAYVKEYFGITPPEDQCEAICIGLAAKVKETAPKDFNWA